MWNTAGTGIRNVDVRGAAEGRGPRRRSRRRYEGRGREGLTCGGGLSFVVGDKWCAGVDGAKYGHGRGLGRTWWSGRKRE